MGGWSVGVYLCVFVWGSLGECGWPPIHPPTGALYASFFNRRCLLPRPTSSSAASRRKTSAADLFLLLCYYHPSSSPPPSLSVSSFFRLCIAPSLSFLASLSVLSVSVCLSLISDLLQYVYALYSTLSFTVYNTLLLSPPFSPASYPPPSLNPFLLMLLPLFLLLLLLLLFLLTQECS